MQLLHENILSTLLVYDTVRECEVYMRLLEYTQIAL